MCENFTIARCPASLRPDALRILHAGLPSDQQIALVHALQATGHQDDSAFAGLFVASNDNKIVGAAWVQLTPGQTAVTWLPATSCPAAIQLMQAMAQFLDEHQVSLAQLLFTDEDAISPVLLKAGGFERLAKLDYLAADKQLFPTQQPETQLDFSPHASDDPARLGNVILSTYEKSQDCPRLNGVRNSEDVLEGYRQQGTFAAERWFFVQHQSNDIGVLILTSHQDGDNWELVYMGLLPEARGNGFGREILDFAMWQANLGNAERLVLAVDETNQPALDTYHHAGFAPWDHRTVYARLRAER